MDQPAQVPQPKSLSGYPNGNFERWTQLFYGGLSTLWDTMTRTIEPLIYASLLDLLGNDNSFMKNTGQIRPLIDKTDVLIGFVVTSVYDVPDFKGFAGDPKAAEHDRAIIVNRLQSAGKAASWGANAVKFDFASGRVVFSYTLMAGGAQGVEPN